ncbi:hypothetical protein [Kineococcus terrestris]|uniref:hypothetical protein n=1 Tax=Kineococcus terrestris TaxID=2044856 RepID=UPI0034DB639D
MPKKKLARRRPGGPQRPTGELSPVRAGGRALDGLQVPYRTFLELEEDETVMPAGDIEARLMESLGWFLLERGEDVVPAAARRFEADDLRGFLHELVPQVAQEHGVDPQALVDETRVAWTTYLMFLGESGQWEGQPEELAACLDVVSGGATGAEGDKHTVLDAVEAVAVAAGDDAERRALARLPFTRGVGALLDRLAAGEDVGTADVATGRGVDLVRGAVGEDGPDATALWLEWLSGGVVEVEDGRTRVPGARRGEDGADSGEDGADADEGDLDLDVARDVAVAWVGEQLAAAGSPAAVVGALTALAAAVVDPVDEAGLADTLAGSGDEALLPQVRAVVQRLADGGLLSGEAPWRADEGFARTVLQVLEQFFDPPSGGDFFDSAGRG